MNPHAQVSRLLHAAVTEVPASMASVRLDNIHRRFARRRQRGVALVAVGVAAVAVVAVGVATPHGSGRVPVATPSSAGPSARSADPATAWRVVYVDSTDRKLTVYAMTPQDLPCLEPALVHTAVTENAGTVTIAVTYPKKPGKVVCDGTGSAVPMPITLSAPLGTRQILDASDGTVIIPFREADLPTVPDTYQPVHTSLPPRGTFWASAYDRNGGPQLTFTGNQRAANSHSPFTTIQTQHFGSRTIRLIRLSSGSYAAIWSAHGIDYSMQAVPAEGKAMTLSAFDAVLSELAWGPWLVCRAGSGWRHPREGSGVTAPRWGGTGAARHIEIDSC